MSTHSSVADWQHLQNERAAVLNTGKFTLGIADWTQPLHTRSPEWLLPGLLQKQAIHILTSDTGCCKTWLGLSMLLSGILGTPVLDIAPTQRFSSLYLAADSPEWDIGQQLSSLILASGSPKLPPEPHAFIMPMGFLFENATHMALISDFVRHWSIDAFFIDVLLYSHTGDENDNSYMARTVLRMAKHLRDDLGLAIYILHHNSKPRPDMAVSYRGAGTIVQAAEHHQTLTRRGQLITLHAAKTRGPNTIPDNHFQLRPSPLHGGLYLGRPLAPPHPSPDHLPPQSGSIPTPEPALPQGLHTILQWLQQDGPHKRRDLLAKWTALNPPGSNTSLDNALQHGRRTGQFHNHQGRWTATTPDPSSASTRSAP